MSWVVSSFVFPLKAERWWRAALFSGLCTLLPLQAHAGEEQYIELSAELSEGRKIWMDNCEGCHGYGIAGAPIPMRTRDWAPRVDKARDELYQHALQGFFGPDDTYMPARGGNESLTDEEVIQAVNYMVALAKHYLEETEKLK